MGQTVSGAQLESWYERKPDYSIVLEPAGSRISAVFHGKTVAATDDALVLRETGHEPVYYFPRRNVRMGFLEKSTHRTFCPFKGEASYWTINVGGKRARDAVWSYEDPLREVAPIQGYLAFYWDKMDAWYAGDRLLSAPAD